MSLDTRALSKLRIPSGMPLVNWLCGGWTMLVFAFLYLPILLLVVYSFNESDLGVEWTGFTFDWYAKLWNNQPLIDALKNSLIVASVTTVPLGPARHDRRVAALSLPIPAAPTR